MNLEFVPCGYSRDFATELVVDRGPSFHCNIPALGCTTEELRGRMGTIRNRLNLGIEFSALAQAREYHYFQGALCDQRSMLDWSELNSLLGRHWLEAPRMRLTYNRQPVPMSEYTREVQGRRLRRQLQPGRLAQLLADGATLTIDAVDELHGPVSHFAAKLQQLTGRAVQANLYAAGEGATGFGVHFDPHDVFVVQLHGTKSWRLYGSAASDGTGGELHRAPRSTLPGAEIDLHPGDILYLPREYWHDVSTPDGTFSVHITFGVHPATGRDLVDWLLSSVLAADRTLHAEVPPLGFEAEAYEYVQRVQQVLTDALREPNLLERFSYSWNGKDLGEIMPSLPHVKAVPGDPALEVRLLAPRLTIRETPEGMATTFRGEYIGLDSRSALILDTLGDLEPCLLGTLSRILEISIEETAVAVQNLVRKDLIAVSGS